MQTDITLNIQASLLKTGDQVTIQADGLRLLVKRQEESISVYTYGSADEAIKEEWTLFTEAEPTDSAFEVAARAVGWSQIRPRTDTTRLSSFRWAVRMTASNTTATGKSSALARGSR